MNNNRQSRSPSRQSLSPSLLPPFSLSLSPCSSSPTPSLSLSLSLVFLILNVFVFFLLSSYSLQSRSRLDQTRPESVLCVCASSASGFAWWRARRSSKAQTVLAQSSLTLHLSSRTSPRRPIAVFTSASTTTHNLYRTHTHKERTTEYYNLPIHRCRTDSHRHTPSRR